MINKDKVLITSCHHRPIPFFTHSMQKLKAHGYNNFLIQNTCIEEWARFPDPEFPVHDCKAHTNYADAMQNYKRLLDNLPSNIEYIVLIDNDLFLGNPNILDKYIRIFEERNYDFSAYYNREAFYNMNVHNFEDNFLADVPIQKIFNKSPDLSLCNFSPSCPSIFPWPYWENAFQITRRSMWDKLTVDDVSRGRKYINALVRENAKLGVLKVNYIKDNSFLHKGKHTVSHCGEEWFHFGDFMYFYNAIEDLSRFHEYSRITRDPYTQCRFGCLFACIDIYGPLSLPEHIRENLYNLTKILGGREECIKAWQDLVKMVEFL